MPKAFQSEKILMDPERIPWRSGVRKACGSGAGSIESKAFESFEKKKRKRKKERTEPNSPFSFVFANFHRPPSVSSSRISAYSNSKKGKVTISNRASISLSFFLWEGEESAKKESIASKRREKLLADR